MLGLLFLGGLPDCFGPAGQGGFAGDLAAALRREVLAALLSALPAQLLDVLTDAVLKPVYFRVRPFSSISWHSNSLAVGHRGVKIALANA